MFKIIPKTRSKKNNKPTPEEKARVKKVKKQRKKLEDADAYARARNILSYDPDTDVTSIDLVTDREWLIQDAREAEAELLATIPSLGVLESMLFDAYLFEPENESSEADFIIKLFGPILEAMDFEIEEDPFHLDKLTDTEIYLRNRPADIIECGSNSRAPDHVMGEPNNEPVSKRVCPPKKRQSKGTTTSHYLKFINGTLDVMDKYPEM
ncbi:hypothetical protein BD770DRAFT_439965 [Pilaira anomala]|nr:hypothetical protein BD770DRAFT_439965 [Pilaira anomala]